MMKNEKKENKVKGRLVAAAIFALISAYLIKMILETDPLNPDGGTFGWRGRAGCCFICYGSV
jgi:hypothetical protein